MHVCFAVMIGTSMARLCRHRIARIAWRGYPLWDAFVVIARFATNLRQIVRSAAASLRA